MSTDKKPNGTNTGLRDSLIVFRKEMVDAFRDRKTLMMILLTAVLIGPLMLIALSVIVGQQEEKSERREVWVAGLERAPELHNYLLRQGMKVNEAPADYEAQLRDFRLGESVILIPEDYKEKQSRGESPELRVVFDSANRQSTVLVSRNVGLLSGYNREQGSLEMAMRGVAPAVLEPFRIQERNLASAQSRSSQMTAMVPWMVMMAVLFGGLTVALDTTAGERERASLEPLLTNPDHAVLPGVGQVDGCVGRGHGDCHHQRVELLPGQDADPERSLASHVPIWPWRGHLVPDHAAAPGRGGIGRADAGRHLRPHVQGSAKPLHGGVAGIPVGAHDCDHGFLGREALAPAGTQPGPANRDAAGAARGRIAPAAPDGAHRGERGGDGGVFGDTGAALEEPRNPLNRQGSRRGLGRQNGEVKKEPKGRVTRAILSTQPPAAAVHPARITRPCKPYPAPSADRVCN